MQVQASVRSAVDRRPVPFKYNLTLGESIDPGTELVFQSWIDEVWTHYHKEKVAFAILKGHRGSGKAYTNGACALLEHAELKPDQVVRSDTLLGFAGADGESIPYGKPYSVFRYDD